jgi:hypothetical protein
MAKWTLGHAGKTNPIQSQFKPNTKPNQSQYKANSNPIQTQFKANSCPPSVWRDKGKKMLLRLTINGLRKPVLIFYVKQSPAIQVSKDVWVILELQTIERKEQQW